MATKGSKEVVTIFNEKKIAPISMTFDLGVAPLFALFGMAVKDGKDITELIPNFSKKEIEMAAEDKMEAVTNFSKEEIAPDEYRRPSILISLHCSLFLQRDATPTPSSGQADNQYLYLMQY